VTFKLHDGHQHLYALLEIFGGSYAFILLIFPISKYTMHLGSSMPSFISNYAISMHWTNFGLCMEEKEEKWLM
jgi:hypothetical protein